MQKFHQSDVLRIKHLHILIGHAQFGIGQVGEQTIRQSMALPTSRRAPDAMYDAADDFSRFGI